MENQQNIFSELFLHFVFSLFEVMYWYLLLKLMFLIYGCVEGIHANYIVNLPYFECFQANLYLSFIHYHPV